MDEPKPLKVKPDPDAAIALLQSTYFAPPSMLGAAIDHAKDPTKSKTWEALRDLMIGWRTAMYAPELRPEFEDGEVLKKAADDRTGAFWKELKEMEAEKPPLKELPVEPEGPPPTKLNLHRAAKTMREAAMELAQMHLDAAKMAPLKATEDFDDLSRVGEAGTETRKGTGIKGNVANVTAFRAALATSFDIAKKPTIIEFKALTGQKKIALYLHDALMNIEILLKRAGDVKIPPKQLPKAFTAIGAELDEEPPPARTRSVGAPAPVTMRAASRFVAEDDIFDWDASVDDDGTP